MRACAACGRGLDETSWTSLVCSVDCVDRWANAVAHAGAVA